VIVHVVPSIKAIKDLVEPLHRVALLEGPELMLVGLDLALQEGVGLAPFLWTPQLVAAVIYAASYSSVSILSYSAGFL